MDLGKPCGVPDINAAHRKMFPHFVHKVVHVPVGHVFHQPARFQPELLHQGLPFVIFVFLDFQVLEGIPPGDVQEIPLMADAGRIQADSPSGAAPCSPVEPPAAASEKLCEVRLPVPGRETVFRGRHPHSSPAALMYPPEYPPTPETKTPGFRRGLCAAAISGS